MYRYIELYYNGGIYLDNKVTPIVPFDEFLPSTGSFLSYDSYKTKLCNAFMAFTSHNKLMKNIIKLAIKNIQDHYYGDDQTSATGPQALMKAYEKLSTSNKHLITINAYFNTPYVVIKHENSDILFLFHNGEYRRSIAGIRNPCYYYNLWKNHALYYERICDPDRGLVIIRNNNEDEDYGDNI